MKTTDTKATKITEVTRDWHLVDLKNKVLGRAGTEIALFLMGKAKPYFVRNLDCGDFVVVINAKDVKVTGKKQTEKMYYRHSGYPGGFKGESFADLLERRPEEVITHMVKGMLPQNRLRDKMMQRLFVFKGEEHTFAEKFKK